MRAGRNARPFSGSAQPVLRHARWRQTLTSEVADQRYQRGLIMHAGLAKSAFQILPHSAGSKFKAGGD
ncbi:hypothetical protein LMTR13_21560 [Bradyrhizobium icense]|uniref:Uncharacterized protein n=1 Tax=Bradyrhizobium icense TaxID=1274631 RepID=A0A1B1UHZ1_9BRAD|nr:hypothetical protein LMTR13_21560 [Bradyrhizobium icense]